jgi:hypothetical protein
MYCLRSLRGLDRGFESHSGHRYLIRVCVFCVCVVLCLGRDLATSLSPVQGVLPPVNDQETEKSKSITDNVQHNYRAMIVTITSVLELRVSWRWILTSLLGCDNVYVLVFYFTMQSEARLYSYVWRNLEGSGRDLIQVLSWCLEGLSKTTVPKATDKHATIWVLLQTVFSTRSVEKRSKEDNWGNQVSSVRESMKKRVQLKGNRCSEWTWARNQRNCHC